MKTLLVSAIILAAMLGQDPDHPFPNHEQPPEGWTCSRDAADKAHLCFCTGMTADPMCKTTPAEPIPEDPQCKSWCWRSHCECKVMCDSIRASLSPAFDRHKAYPISPYALVGAVGFILQGACLSIVLWKRRQR